MRPRKIVPKIAELPTPARVLTAITMTITCQRAKLSARTNAVRCVLILSGTLLDAKNGWDSAILWLQAAAVPKHIAATEYAVQRLVKTNSSAPRIARYLN